VNDLTLAVVTIIGRTFIFTIQKFPLVRDLSSESVIGRYLRELFGCDFCLGVWVYFFLSAVFHVALFSSVIYCPVISELATGTIISLVMHLISIGWREKFGSIVIKG